MGEKRPKKACMAPSSGIGKKSQTTDSKELIKSTGSQRKNSRKRRKGIWHASCHLLFANRFFRSPIECRSRGSINA